MLASPASLVTRRGEVFWLRKAVPIGLTHSLSKSDIRRTLRTSNRRIACDAVEMPFHIRDRLMGHQPGQEDQNGTRQKARKHHVTPLRLADPFFGRDGLDRSAEFPGESVTAEIVTQRSIQMGPGSTEPIERRHVPALPRLPSLPRRSRPLVIGVAGKGGTAKTTTLIQLAQLASQLNHVALIVDVDNDDGSASKWWEVRSASDVLVETCAPHEVEVVVARGAARGAELILIDTPPARNAYSARIARLAD